MMVMIASFSDKRVNISEGPWGPSTDQELPFPLIAPHVAFCSLLQMVRKPHTSPQTRLTIQRVPQALLPHSLSPSHTALPACQYEALAMRSGSLFPNHNMYSQVLHSLSGLESTTVRKPRFPGLIAQSCPVLECCPSNQARVPLT